MAIVRIFVKILKTNKCINSRCFSTATRLKPKDTKQFLEEVKLKVGKYNINYLKVGDGDHHVLAWPGVVGTIWTDFRPQIESFNRDNFTLIIWDPPGYGESRPRDKEFTNDFYEKDADIAYDFLKALNISKVSLLGWSNGGISSMILAARQPALIDKMVVWGVISHILPQEVEGYKKVKDIKTLSKRMTQPMINIYGEELYAKYWGGWIDGMESIFMKKGGNICAHLLRNISAKTLIMYGEKDPLVDKSHVSYLHKNIIDSRIHLYPEGKHNIHLNYADDFNKRVQEFLLTA